jgi:outer membrane protein assembly factor BamA
VNYGVCTGPSISLLRNRQSLSPLALSFFSDHTNDPLNPSSGFQAQLALEHASKFTLSDFRYNRVSAEASYYHPMGRAVLAGRVRGGWVKSLRSAGDSIGTTGNVTELVIHPRERFYAGGSQSVRGYGENQLGPRILTVDPLKLIDTEVAGHCTRETIVDGTCDPTFLVSDNFQPRPTGGTALLEGNLEYRVPIWGALTGALFVDGAFVGEGSLGSVTEGTGAITPGFGVRYQSPAGPIRVDLGIRPKLAERLTVLTQVPDTNSQGQLVGALVQLRTPKLYDPTEGKSGFKKVLSRLTLHLSIGQAF